MIQKTLLLIDANSVIHRCFHALPPLTTPDGRPIQAIYGLANILTKLWREERPAVGEARSPEKENLWLGRPDYAAALFDRPEPTFRKKEYKEYKAQRPPAPDELISQIIEAHKLFSEYGIRTFEKAGFEADDGIATLAEKFRKEPNLRIVILTGDLDTLQLVEDGHVVVRTFKKGVSDTMIYDEAAILERYGLKPNQLIDYKALVGDPSDNIKGLAGVGPKTASELLQKYGTIERFYKEGLVHEPKLEKRFAGLETQVEFMKKLVTLERQVPLEIKNLDELAIHDGPQKALGYFETLGFASLVKRLRGGEEKTTVTSESVASGRLSFELESHAVFIGLAPKEDELLSDKPKVGFGVKNFLKDRWRNAKECPPPYIDLGVAFWLLDPDLKNYEPDEVFKKFLKREWKGDAVDLETAYAFVRAKLAQYELEKVFYEIEMALLPVLAQMETWGVSIDLTALRNLEKKIERDLQKLISDVYALAGETFNINSSQQLGKIIFEKLKIIGKIKKTAGGKLSTNAEALLELRGSHPVIEKILDYRELFKLQSTYVKPLQALVDDNGRLHTEFIQTGAATGRLSSQTPNVQNIPKGSVWADELRLAFVAPQGHSLLSFDYSQIDIRILASLSGDPKMKDAFNRDLDIHRLTAAQALHLPIEKIGDKERQLAKILNFGLIYGMGASSFAKASGLSRAEAQGFISNYFSEFSKIREWQEETKRNARTFGYVQTLTGRRRYVPGIVSSSPRFASEAERIATNQPVQGLEADLLKLAMVRVAEAFTKKGLWGKGVKLLLSIHDELLFEVRDDMMKIIAAEVKKIMEQAYALDVPLKVDMSSGKDWGHMQKLSF